MKKISNILNPLFYILFSILIAFNLYLIFSWSPNAEGMGTSTRILFFHVPLAWCGSLSFLISGIFSIKYLIKKNPLDEIRFHNSALIGYIFIILTFISGSIWAKLTWGSFWSDDPRNWSVVYLLLIYTAYFTLKNSLDKSKSSKEILAAYIIFAFIAMPFFIFILPRLGDNSLHPNSIINKERKITMDTRIFTTLMVSLASFTLYYFKLFFFLNRRSKRNIKFRETGNL